MLRAHDPYSVDFLVFCIYVPFFKTWVANAPPNHYKWFCAMEDGTDITRSSPPYGRRLFPILIDEIARDSPTKPFVAIPKSSNPKDGFFDISYHLFAGAINKCAWWIEKELGRSRDFGTVAYMGPLDLLYPILIFATVKAGYKVSSGHHHMEYHF